METQPGKLIAAVVLFLVAGAMAYYVTRDPAALPQNFNFVCVETGETFNIAKRDIRALPARNPKTERYTLLPVSQRDDGALYVGEHYRGSVVGELKDVNQFVDPKTLKVKQ